MMSHKQVETHCLQQMAECRLRFQSPSTTQAQIPHRRHRPASVTLIQRRQRRRQTHSRPDLQRGDHQPSGCRNWLDDVAASPQHQRSCLRCRYPTVGGCLWRFIATKSRHYPKCQAAAGHVTGITVITGTRLLITYLKSSFPAYLYCSTYFTGLTTIGKC